MIFERIIGSIFLFALCSRYPVNSGSGADFAFAIASFFFVLWLLWTTAETGRAR